MRGLNPEFRHVPTLGNRGAMVAAYAIAYIRGTEPQIELMHKEDIAKIQAASKGGNIWAKWPGEMWRKSAIKRAFKYLPDMDMTDELIAGLAIEYRNDSTMITAGDVDNDTLAEIFEGRDEPAVLVEAPAAVKPVNGTSKPKQARKPKNEAKKPVVEVKTPAPKPEVEPPVEAAPVMRVEVTGKAPVEKQIDVPAPVNGKQAGDSLTSLMQELR